SQSLLIGGTDPLPRPGGRAREPTGSAPILHIAVTSVIADRLVPGAARRSAFLGPPAPKPARGRPPAGRVGWARPAPCDLDHSVTTPARASRAPGRLPALLEVLPGGPVRARLDAPA